MLRDTSSIRFGRQVKMNLDVCKQKVTGRFLQLLNQ